MATTDLELEQALKASLQILQPSEEADLSLAMHLSTQDPVACCPPKNPASEQELKFSDEDLQLAAALSLSEAEELQTQQVQIEKLKELEKKAEREAELKRKEEEASLAAVAALLKQDEIEREERKKEEEATQQFLTAEKEMKRRQETDTQAKIFSELSEHLNPISTAQKNKFMQDIAPIASSDAVLGERFTTPPGLPKTMDAHQFTCTDIRAGIVRLREIDDALRPIHPIQNPDMQPQKVLEEVLTQMESLFADLNITNITTSITKLIQAGNPLDTTETLANVQQLLSRTWTLAKQLGPDFTYKFAAALDNNIGDQGGCIPGLVARLYSHYAGMLYQILPYAPTCAVTPKNH